MKVNLNQFKRFEKQIILKKVGFAGQKKIFSANVLIVGLGGLGCPLLTYLAASGVGKIGIVDFRKVLRISNSMQILGKKFISAEKKLNQKFNLKQVTLKEKEKEILKQKKIVSIEKYNSIIKLFKKEVFEIQSNNKQERLILNNSFQKIQKNLKDLLANVIKEISMKKNINIVLLKENIFILNDQSADLTDEVLNSFNKKTKNIKIKIIIAD